LLLLLEDNLFIDRNYVCQIFPEFWPVPTQVYPAIVMRAKIKVVEYFPELLDTQSPSEGVCDE